MGVMKSVVPADISGMGAGLDFIESSLKSMKMKQKFIIEALLLSEESMMRLLRNAEIGSELHFHVYPSFGTAKITISARGPELPPADVDQDFDLGNNIDRGCEDAIRAILLRSFDNKHRFYRKGKYNFVKIIAGEPERLFANVNILSFVAAIVIGLLMRSLVPESVSSALNNWVFQPVQQIFLNLLMLCTAPAVFLSIITGVAEFSSFSDPGRVSLKVIVGYFITSVLAIIIGTLCFTFIRPGEFGVLSSLCTNLSDEVLRPNLIETIINIVPTDIITPFLKMDAAQLVFFALICGIAIGRIGESSRQLRDIFEGLNALFSKFADILMNIIPVATLCSTVSLILSLGGVVLIDLAEMLGTLFIALAAITLVYCLFVGIIGRLDPLVMLRKIFPALRGTFIMSSGMSALPKNMRCCKNSLGISPKVYSFSMPFGASVNMDGNCIYLCVAGLFLARLCGIEITSSDILPLGLFVLVVTMGAPIARGTVLLCLTVMLSQMGVNNIALSLIIGINATVEMFLAASDTLGDFAVSVMVARTEDLLDTDVYYSNKRAAK